MFGIVNETLVQGLTLAIGAIVPFLALVGFISALSSRLTKAEIAAELAREELVRLTNRIDRNSDRLDRMINHVKDRDDP